MSCRAPGASLDPLFTRWRAGVVLHSIHDCAFDPSSFNAGRDALGRPTRPTRFAPIQDAAGKVVPYRYGGATLDCAIFETIFHDVAIEAVAKHVDLDRFATRAHVELVFDRDLKLVDLTTDGLHRLRVPKHELITSPLRSYPATARWAEAFHRRFADVDGLLWMSARRDRDASVVLFGDRVAGTMRGRQASGPLAIDRALRDAVLQVALRAGIEAD